MPMKPRGYSQPPKVTEARKAELRARAKEIFDSAPTPLFDEFPRRPMPDSEDGKKVESMYWAQVEKLKQKYPGKVVLRDMPEGSNMYSWQSRIMNYLISFVNAEREAQTGTVQKSADELIADEQRQMDIQYAQERTTAQRMARREDELRGLFGGKSRKPKKGKKVRKTRRLVRK